MLPTVINHLWQSTLFALLAGLITLTLSKNRAQVRFCLWLSASMKFLLPFPLLVMIGQTVRRQAMPQLQAVPEWSITLDHFSQPGALVTGALNIVPSPASSYPNPPQLVNMTSFLWAIWGCGVALLLLRRLLQWRRLRRAMRNAHILDMNTPVPVVSTPELLEPGLFGIVRPVLLLPEGIAQRLTAQEMQTILAHEICHWRRRDNLTATLHMFVETLFWFHPLVWWLGTRLVVEREKACDEAVIQSGNDPLCYAEGILKVCKFYLAQTQLNIAGVSGGNLKQRIEAIVTEQIFAKLGFSRKLLLALAGCLVLMMPVAGCMTNNPPADSASEGPIPVGAGRREISLGTVSLDVFTYRPTNCTPSELLLVFHDHTRQAEPFRDVMEPIADRYCLLIAAPRFDQARFPNWRYQYGGLANKDGIRGRDNWTGSAVLALVDQLRRREGKPDLPYSLLGGSAGAQFLSRVAAVTPNDARQIILVNAGSYVAASLEADAPYGLHGLPNSEELLKHYLAEPISFLLGAKDNDPDAPDNRAGAERQGATRYERGLKVFAEAQSLAQQRGLPFRWRLIQEQDKGHDPMKMLSSPVMIEALGLK